MIIVPVYNAIVLPDTTFYFKNEFFQDMNVEEVKTGDEMIFLIRKERESGQDMSLNNFYPIGVAGRVISVDAEGTVGVRATQRLDISEIEGAENESEVTAEPREEIQDLGGEELQNLVSRIRGALLGYVQKFQWGIMARGYILHWKTLNEIAVGLSSYLTITSEEKYAITAADKLSERGRLIEKAVYEFIEISRVSGEAEDAQKETNEKVYREDALKKQIGFLQQQLDDMHPENVSDVRRFEKKIKSSGMNETARKEAEKVLNRMKQEGKDSHEYGMLYDYLDFVTSLQWKKNRMTDIHLDEAEKVLDKQHYGLEKVKKRIIQHLAVMTLNKKQSGSILLFVGAPGTGKTSIGQSIAEALHRKYVRISLGGIHDEAEIRGHRRTYIGAMPGRIMEGMKTSGVSNPVMVLDEVDKLTARYDGDPASALLEVLDPEQNHTFTDHYMNVPYDLSDVLFVCTANTTDTIPAPLLDRMEVIQFPGYTAVEKYQIARKHLLPRAMKDTGIKAKNLRVPDETLETIIANYTMESGVRGLKKQLDALCRSAAVTLVKGEKKSLTVSPKSLSKYLDQKPIHHEHIMEKKEPGVVTGLAWTAAGGEILFIESLATKGTGQLKLTGQLGEIMQESAQIAVSLVKAMYPKQAEQLKKQDIHIHVPAGAIPKDGPSAGITLTTALASLVTGKAVNPEYAMTGEVSLQGRVLPIGGLPEKLMAAQRAGIRKVFIPEENMDDLDDVAKEVKEELEIVPVRKVTDVLEKALV